MGYFVKIDNNSTKTYHALDSHAFKSFLEFASGLPFKKLVYIGNDSCEESYYDTPGHLLNKSGVVLSKFTEGNNAFFKVENTTFLSKVLNKLTKEVFIHKIGLKDSLTDHAFYVKDGITALYTTPFSVDLENVLKNAVPKMSVTITAEIYQLITGNGMQAKIALEHKSVNNSETKRAYSVESMTMQLEDNSPVYQKEFDEFNALFQKNCKEFLPISYNQFDFATKVTKPLPPKPPKVKEPQKKTEIK